MIHSVSRGKPNSPSRCARGKRRFHGMRNSRLSTHSWKTTGSDGKSLLPPALRLLPPALRPPPLLIGSLTNFIFLFYRQVGVASFISFGPRMNVSWFEQQEHHLSPPPTPIRQRGPHSTALMADLRSRFLEETREPHEGRRRRVIQSF